MPELPEVERARALIQSRGLRRRIVAVDDRDGYVCRPHGPGEIADALVGRELTAAHRRGKAMWCEASDDGPVLGLHLGMSGRIVIDGVEGGDPKPAAAGRGWDRFTLDFEDGGHLTMRDPRRLSRVRLEPNLDRLGPDAARIAAGPFRERVGRGTGPIKARIMDQAVIAGVGNLLADEGLWRARVDPRRAAGDLARDELDGLRRALRAAIRDAIAKGGVHTGKVIPARRRDGSCPRCGAAMRRATIGGRTTWWCSAEQQG